MLRAAGVREGLLLRPRGQHRGHGGDAAAGRGAEGQLCLLVPAGGAGAHGRDGPHRPSHPLPAIQ